MADVSFSNKIGARTGAYSGTATATVNASCSPANIIGYQKNGGSLVKYSDSYTQNNQTSHSWGNVSFGLTNVGPAAGTYTSVSARGFCHYYQGSDEYGSWRTFTVTLPAYSCAVTLNAGQGSGGTGSVTASYGSDLPDITAPSRSGYAFGGYYSGEGGTGTKYYNADGTGAHVSDFDAPTTLYALWEPMSILHLVRDGAAETVTDIRVVESGTVKRVLSVWSVENGVPKQGV